jgi:hypothetical protein
MSKKQRRQRKPNLPPEAYQMPSTAAAPVVRPSAGKAAPTVTPAQHSAATVNWQAEYGDVLGDLKRTAILAGVIMVVMIGLSFIIH